MESPIRQTRSAQSANRSSQKGNPAQAPAQTAVRQSQKAPMGAGAAVSAKAQAHQEMVRGRSPFLPILLVVLSLILMVGFQLTQLLKGRATIKAKLEAQEVPLQESKKVRQQLDVIVKQTYQLAVNGNKNAEKIVTQMKRAGLTFTAKDQ